MLGRVLGARDTAVRKTVMVSALRDFLSAVVLMVSYQNHLGNFKKI